MNAFNNKLAITIIAISLAAVLILAVGLGVYFGVYYTKTPGIDSINATFDIGMPVGKELQNVSSRGGFHGDGLQLVEAAYDNRPDEFLMDFNDGRDMDFETEFMRRVNTLGEQAEKPSFSADKFNGDYRYKKLSRLNDTNKLWLVYFEDSNTLVAVMSIT